jgi:transposase InsO family protein
MLSEKDFLFWCERLRLNERARATVTQVRSSDPSRRVRSSRGGNISGRYPSRKMRMVIQFESHKNELPHIQQREHDRAVLEYYDQPPQIKLDYTVAGGKRISFWHTADFFVIQKQAAGWEECKTEEDLARLAETQPERYCRDEDGSWRCPPGEEYAERFGLYYRVVSSAEINWTFQRNVEYLEDYYRANAPAVGDSARSAVLSLVASEPGISLEDLFGRVEGEASRDDVQMMIAREEIFVDLYRCDIADFDRARAYPDADTAAAYGRVIETPPGERVVGRFVSLRPGELVVVDGVGWKIANVGETMVGLVGEGNAFTEIPVRAFEEMVKEGRAVGAQGDGPPRLHPEAERLFLGASREALAAANRRAELVAAWEAGELEPDERVPVRTLRHWRALRDAAEARYGNGYVGLLAKSLPGNPADKLPPATRQLLKDFIENDYETHKQKGKFAVYAAYQRACEAKQTEPASYKTFCRAVKQRPAYEQTYKRRGRRAAYKYKEFYLELEYTTPRHGGHPFHVCHIDHTELDVELVCSTTKRNLGRPWLTILVDAYSRRFLGLYLTFDPPSYRSCMMVLRDCVSRFKRLPQTLIVDGGIEFASVYLETLLAAFECTKKERPPAEARVGSLGERVFGTLHTQFVHNLRGNTQITRNVRQVTKSVNPKGKAVWTLQTLNRFLHQYAFEVYDGTEHGTLGQSPRDAFAAGMAQSGSRAHRLIAYDETFKMLTLPSTKKGTAKVEPGRGIKVNTIYYWSESFRTPLVERSSVPVRYDPWDASTVYAHVRGRWTRCLSQYHKTFRGRSERELALATAVLRKRLSRGKEQLAVTARRLADFLASAEEEEIVMAQRLADIEGRPVRAAIDGGGGAAHAPAQPPEATEPGGGGGAPEDEAGADASVPEDPEEYEEF